MHHRLPLFATLVLTALLFSACGSGRMSTRRASEQLKPAQSLPERERSQSPYNLLIRIENVADRGSSYKNFVVLTINGKDIAPERAEHNMKSAYVYKLRLTPGIYDIKAKYHVVGFWRKRIYQIKTDERVRILPGARTELSVELEKNSNGFPQNKKNFFAIRQFDLEEPITTHVEPEAPRKIKKLRRTEAPPKKKALAEPKPKRKKAAERAPEPEIERPEPPHIDEPKTLPQPTVAQPRPVAPARGRIKLQINSLPVGADIYVDDRFVGQAPARVMIDRSEGHIIQITKEGFKEYIKVIDVEELAGKNDLQVIVRLEKEN